MKFITPVCNPSDVDGFNYAFIDIDAALAQAILSRRDAYVRLNEEQNRSLSSIEFYDCTAVFLNGVPDGTSIPQCEADGDRDETELTAESLVLHVERSELDRMIITDDSVYWTAIPKHCDSQNTVETRPIDYTTIEKIAQGVAT